MWKKGPGWCRSSQHPSVPLARLDGEEERGEDACEERDVVGVGLARVAG